jgi:hypothetical protein
MIEIDDATFTLIRDLTVEVDRQGRRCSRWLGVDNQKLLRAMRRKAKAMAERHRLLYGEAAGDRLQREADRGHHAFCTSQRLDWDRSI